MKIVMCYTDGDGCTYSCDVVLPLEHESPEAAFIEFEQLFNEANIPTTMDGGWFTFCGAEFYCSTFLHNGVITLPNFFTLDKWFDVYRMN